MTAWPETLPLRFERRGYKEGVPDNRIATAMDAGPKKRRRRFTAGVWPLGGTMIMSNDQFTEVRSFYLEEVGEAGTFTFTHQRTGEELTVLFASPPEIVEPFGVDSWRVAVQFEVQP